ncbi:Uncharacterised protein [uncultured archaeon]|nr:Uncharacterised protein [uncultured archaeon]
MVGLKSLDPIVYSSLREKILSSNSRFKEKRLEALDYFEKNDFQKEKDSPIQGFYMDYYSLPYSEIDPSFKEYKEFDYANLIPFNENKFIAFHYAISDYKILTLDENKEYEYVQNSDFEHLILKVSKDVKASLTVKKKGVRNFTSLVCEIILEENSSLNYFDIQEYHSDTKNYSMKRFDLKENSRNQCFSYEKASKWSVSVTDHYFTGKNSQGVNYSAFIADNEAHVDFKNNSFHFVPNTKNDIIANGLCNNASQAVSRGLIHINKEAPNTLSHFASNILLLDNKSKANALPSLEIDNNNVSSKHAAAVSNVDKQQKFYLNSRGFGDKEAEQLISKAFVFKISNKLESPFKEQVNTFLETKV